MSLKGYQRSYLTRFAHKLQPSIWIGKEGLSPSVLQALEMELENKEIIKVKFVDCKDSKKLIMEEAATSLQAILVRIIGNIAILYRHQEDHDKRVVHLPK